MKQHFGKTLKHTVNTDFQHTNSQRKITKSKPKLSSVCLARHAEKSQIRHQTKSANDEAKNTEKITRNKTEKICQSTQILANRIPSLSPSRQNTSQTFRVKEGHPIFLL